MEEVDSDIEGTRMLEHIVAAIRDLDVQEAKLIIAIEKQCKIDIALTQLRYEVQRAKLNNTLKTIQVLVTN
jgi:hypothetical protein